MHPRTAENLVLFSQLRENGINCRWTGLKKIAIRELITVCTSAEDEEALHEGFELFFRGSPYSCRELADGLIRRALPKLHFDAFDDKKFHLLFGLFKKYGIETFSSRPSLKEVTHEILDIYVTDNCSVKKEVARNVLVEIAMAYEVGEPHDEVHAAISYLTERRGVDANALNESHFSILVDCLGYILLYLCSVFSTPTTNVFLRTKLDAEKLGLLWTTIVEYLPANVSCPGSMDLIRSFIDCCEVKEALYTMNLSNYYALARCPPERFNDLLEILETFMDHGARLNPRPDSSELSFLQGILKAHRIVFSKIKTRPMLLGFIKKCIQRGVDPTLSCVDVYNHEEDLLVAVCDYYVADDKNEMIEYLCDCGADDGLCRDDGMDLWSILVSPSLASRSHYELTSPGFNETLLILLRRGLQTSYIDEYGNNVFHLYFSLYSDDHRIEECCQYGWFRKMDELKFWDVLDALLDAGVQASDVNGAGETPFRAFKRIIPPGYEVVLGAVCFECSQTYNGTGVEPSESVKPIPELTRLRNYLDRLSPISL